LEAARFGWRVRRRATVGGDAGKVEVRGETD
jgi:hypothetical protein